MKSIALLALGVLLGVAVMLAIPHGAPQVVYADPPSGNGDVNGSGKIDIADAIYILGYLFAQGPEPEAIECDTCCPPPSGGALPATGQTACYDIDGNVIDCNNAEYPGQDGLYQTGCPTAGRFVDNGDGTVTDNCTGLMWQKDTADVNEDGQIRIEDLVIWQAALQYCDGLEFAGHDDWRLPNVHELHSIVNNGRFDPSIDLVFGAVSMSYWSSSAYVSYPDDAWSVHFYGGHVSSSGDKFNRLCVRAVRDAD